MKAAVLYGNEDLRYDDYPTPEVVPGTVKVKVGPRASAAPTFPGFCIMGPFYPVVLGHEFSGDVVEVGERRNQGKK